MASTELEPLTVDHVKAIAYIEQYWFRFGKFPTLESFENNLPRFDIDAALEHKTFRIALLNRGIDAPVGSLNDSRLNIPVGLSKEQLAAVVTVVNFEDKRTRASKLKELGITAAQWQGWLKQDSFKEFLQELSASNLQDAAYVANEALIRAMDRGDVNAIKFYSEITGKYQPQTQQVHNVRIVLARVIEAIQRHISDPEILRKIGEDFEAILNNEVEPSRRVLTERIEEAADPRNDDIAALEAEVNSIK